MTMTKTVFWYDFHSKIGKPNAGTLFGFSSDGLSAFVGHLNRVLVVPMRSVFIGDTPLMDVRLPRRVAPMMGSERGCRFGFRLDGALVGPERRSILDALKDARAVGYATEADESPFWKSTDNASFLWRDDDAEDYG